MKSITSQGHEMSQVVQVQVKVFKFPFQKTCKSRFKTRPLSSSYLRSIHQRDMDKLCLHNEIKCSLHTTITHKKWRRKLNKKSETVNMGLVSTGQTQQDKQF